MLRHTAAIFLLLIHLFNTGGYRFFFDRFEQQAFCQLAEKLDKENYTDDQLIELKVALPVPYHANWSSFERYNGEIVVDGIHYNYVKRKVCDDSLILLCIPNHERMSLSSAKDQFFSLVNDLDQSGKEMPLSKSGAFKSINTDFQALDGFLAFPMLIDVSQIVYVDHSEKFDSAESDTDVHPPEEAIG